MSRKENTLNKYLEKYSVLPRFESMDLIEGRRKGEIRVSCMVFNIQTFGVAATEKCARETASGFMLKKLETKKSVIAIIRREVQARKKSELEGWKPFVKAIDDNFEKDEYGFRKFSQLNEKPSKMDENLAKDMTGIQNFASVELQSFKKSKISVKNVAREKILSRWSDKVSESTRSFRKRFVEQLAQ